MKDITTYYLRLQSTDNIYNEVVNPTRFPKRYASAKESKNEISMDGVPIITFTEGRSRFNRIITNTIRWHSPSSISKFISANPNHTFQCFSALDYEILVRAGVDQSNLKNLPE